MMETPIPPFSQIEPDKFDAITPSQFVTFTIPNPDNDDLLLRVAVCDSPLANPADESPSIAAIIVPKRREADWIFCTESGHLQLLFKHRTVSRLILIGDLPPHPAPRKYTRPPFTIIAETESLQNKMKPLLIPLRPKVNSTYGLPELLFLADDDYVAYRVTVGRFQSDIVGEFHVEDVELVGIPTDRKKQLRRRLRFKRAPRVVQSEALLLPVIPNDEATTQTDLKSLRKIEDAKFVADTKVLVQEYLIAMVSSLSLIASHLTKFPRPKALCFGIGGGVLLNFLDTQMGFEVTGVDSDGDVINSSRLHFRFDKSITIRVIVKDAIETIQNFPNRAPPNVDKFDVVFVDLDPSGADNGFSAPPSEFVTKDVFEGLRSLLDEHGGLVINVVRMSEVFYDTLVKELKEVFHKVYEIDVENEDNCVVMAIVSPPSLDDVECQFKNKLKTLIPQTYMDSIVELSSVP